MMTTITEQNPFVQAQVDGDTSVVTTLRRLSGSVDIQKRKRTGTIVTEMLASKQCKTRFVKAVGQPLKKIKTNTLSNLRVFSARFPVFNPNDEILEFSNPFKSEF